MVATKLLQRGNCMLFEYEYRLYAKQIQASMHIPFLWPSFNALYMYALKVLTGLLLLLKISPALMTNWSPQVHSLLSESSRISVKDFSWPSFRLPESVTFHAVSIISPLLLFDILLNKLLSFFLLTES